jgi:hypothetical protein
MKRKATIAAAAAAPVLAMLGTAIPHAGALPAHPPKHPNCKAYPPGKSHLSLNVSKSHIKPDEHDYFQGTLWKPGCVVRNAPITLTRNGTPITTRYTNAYGTYHWLWWQGKQGTFQWQAHFAGNGAAGPADSNVVTVVVSK